MDVSQFGRLVQARMRGIGDVRVKGVVSDLFVAKDHTYLTLRQPGRAGASIDCVVFFRRPALANHEEVIVHVERVDFYAPQGKVQAVVEDVERVGAAVGAREVVARLLAEDRSSRATPLAVPMPVASSPRSARRRTTT